MNFGDDVFSRIRHLKEVSVHQMAIPMRIDFDDFAS